MKHPRLATVVNKHNVSLLIKSVITGMFVGLIVTAYRLALHGAQKITALIVDFVQQTFWAVFPLLFLFVLVAVAIGCIVKKYPLIKGSGIPQVKGLLAGYFDFNWLPELFCKFAAGFTAVTAGLSLGREGPSIHMGALTADGVSKITGTPKEDTPYLLSAGAAAGLAAAFQAPLAGIVFVFEELGQKISRKSVVCVFLACVSAECVSELLIGAQFSFQFDIIPLPQTLYVHLIPLGVLCGCVAALFNQSLLVSLSLHDTITHSQLRPIPAFVIAALLFYISPTLLGTGTVFFNDTFLAEVSIGTVVFLIVIKTAYTALSYGTGAPGGIFFPLLIVGGLIGKLYSATLVQYADFNTAYTSFFMVISMCAFFSGVTRAPLTGCILVCEMVGHVYHALPLIIVAIVAYSTAELLGSRPIYESLLARIMPRRQVG